MDINVRFITRVARIYFAATQLVWGTLIVINSETLIFSLLMYMKSINGTINGHWW